MNHPHHFIVLGLSLMASRAASAQQAQDVTFYLTRGADTISVERVSRSAATLHGELILRAQGGAREDYDVQLRPDGAESATTISFYRSSGDAAPAQVATLTPFGDTMVITRVGAPDQRLPARAGALVYINPSVGLLQQAVIHARAVTAGTAPVDVPLFAAAGGQTVPVHVAWSGADSAVLTLGGVDFRLALGRDGDITGGTIPSQGVRISRAAGLAHVAPPAKPDYAAPPGAPYTATEVTVHTPAGLTLAGTLTIPRHHPPAGAPAIVTITGSGQQERDESLQGIAGYRIFRQLADTLGRRGIAALRLDDRGMGGSDAGPPNATSADYADDIRAALAYLRTRSDIDGRRLGLVGHSEGGMIAPMVAATDPALRGIVLLAGPALSGRQISDFQVRQAIEQQLHSPAAQDSALAANTVVRDTVLAHNAWLRYWFSYDPLVTARRVKTPVLILQGATDHQVTPDQAQMLAAAFRAAGDRSVAVRLFPATDHLFLADSSGLPEGYAHLPSKQVRPEVLGAIADWLVAHL